MSSMIRLVLLGDPVSHSKSPAMHNAALRALGIAGVYEARRVDEQGMKVAAEAVRAGRLHGANITMPHKRLAFELADEVEEEAGRAGSVNTWVLDGGRIVGWSTDVSGIRQVWRKRALPTGHPILILGSGGAAAAALVALASHGELLVAARDPGKADLLVKRVGLPVRVMAWGVPVPGAVLVNCTPLGMGGEPLPVGLLEVAGGLFDLAYSPEATPAVLEAERRGLPVADGLDLLAAQAEVAFRLWTGVDPPLGLMERVARGTA